MDLATVFCPNPDCPARGQTGQGNMGMHSRKDQRFICQQCRKTFTGTKGTTFYRLRTPAQTVSLVLTLLAHGCPLQAIVVAFGFDERTVAAWFARAGRQAQAVQEHLVEQPRALGQVQADEIRVKQQGKISGMALAVAVGTRLWLAGEVSESRDLGLVRCLLARVRRCAARAPLLFCTDGFRAYPRAIREAFRDSLPTGKTGRPRLRVWNRLYMAQVVKHYAHRHVVGVTRRILAGSQAQVAQLIERSQGEGVINTAYIERLNATFRERLASLTRRGRALARKRSTLEYGMYLIGAVYNFCTAHESLRVAAMVNQPAIDRTPARAARITTHCWSVRELLSFQVPPPRWTPPKRRGRRSRILQRVIERWCT
jgi:transposase-like protein